MKVADLLKKIPSPPGAPSPPDTPQKANNLDSTGSIPQGGQMPDFIKKFMNNNSTGKGFSSVDVKKMIENQDIDKYRDENGIVRCPLSQEEKDAFKNRLK